MAKPPKKSPNAGKPTGVRRAPDGDITHVKFKNRQSITPLDQAIAMTKRGETTGVRVNQTGKGREYLQDIPDSSTKDNLQNLPEK